MNLIYFSNTATSPENKQVLRRIEKADRHIKKFFKESDLKDIELTAIKAEYFIVVFDNGVTFCGHYDTGNISMS